MQQAAYGDQTGVRRQGRDVSITASPYPMIHIPPSASLSSPLQLPLFPFPKSPPSPLCFAVTSTLPLTDTPFFALQQLSHSQTHSFPRLVWRFLDQAGSELGLFERRNVICSGCTLDYIKEIEVPRVSAGGCEIVSIRMLVRMLAPVRSNWLGLSTTNPTVLAG